jgi:hypothetical protein
MGTLGAVQTIFVDTILLFRICSVYPLRYLTWQRFVLLVSLPVLLKVARVINLFLFIAALTRAAKGPNAEATLAALWAAAPYLKIEWFAQLVDNIYASSVFLWALWSKRKDKQGSVTGNVKFSFRMRLQTLFWIALSNFIIPALFSVAQIIVIYREVNPVVINQIILANTSIAVIGVVFATVWAGSVNRRIARSDIKPAADVEKIGVMHFATRDTNHPTHDELHMNYQLPAISGQDSIYDEFRQSDSERNGSSLK